MCVHPLISRSSESENWGHHYGLDKSAQCFKVIRLFVSQGITFTPLPHPSSNTFSEKKINIK